MAVNGFRAGTGYVLVDDLRGGNASLSAHQFEVQHPVLWGVSSWKLPAASRDKHTVGEILARRWTFRSGWVPLPRAINADANIDPNSPSYCIEGRLWDLGQHLGNPV